MAHPGPAGCTPLFHDEAAARGIHHVTAAGLDLQTLARERANRTDALGAPSMAKSSRAELATMTGGVAVGDVDGDGWPDLFFADSGPDHLYRNRGDGTFEDASDWLGGAGDGAGRAGLWFDYDNDGHEDLFICNLKDRSRLLHNEGGGGLRDVTDAAGVGAASACQGAAAADVDGDGRLDLLVANYFSWWQNPYPTDGPSTADPEFLYHNKGDGTFTDVAGAAGLLAPGDGPTLGAAFADYDLDGDQDLMLANDFGNPASLWINDGTGHFQRAGPGAGVRSEREGMGVVWADLRGTGRLDAYISNIYESAAGPERRRGNVLLANQGDGTFADQSMASGSFNGLWSWGGAAIDVESDGDVDLFVPNGFDGAYSDAQAQDVGQPPPNIAPKDYADQGHLEPDRFFENQGDGTFRMRADAWGLALRENGRAASAVDFDRDGAVDLVATAVGAPPHLLRNLAPQGHAISLHLQGTRGNRDAVGAMVMVTHEGRIQAVQRSAGGGYESQDSPVLHFGLGTALAADHLQVRWPGGAVQDFGDVAAGAYRLVEGGGLQRADGRLAAP